MRYLLDTSAVIDVIRDSAGEASRRLRKHTPSDIGLPSIVLHELYFGAFRSRRTEHHLSIVDRLQFQVVEFDAEDAREAGRVRAALAGSGNPIGPYDLLIAAQAMTRDLTLVTGNMGEFGRVPGLKVEDWRSS